MTASELAVIQDALEEAGLDTAQIRRAVAAIDAEEVDVVVTRVEVRMDDQYYRGLTSREFGHYRTTFELEVVGLGPERFRGRGFTRILLVK